MANSWERAGRIPDEARIPPERLAGVRPLGGGTYNSVEFLFSEAEFRRAEAGVAPPRAAPFGTDGDAPHLVAVPRPVHFDLGARQHPGRPRGGGGSRRRTDRRRAHVLGRPARRLRPSAAQGGGPEPVAALDEIDELTRPA